MAWNGPKWLSSWHNFASEVTNDFSFAERISIADWTLEGDGEEMPGVVFTRDEKLDIARMLDEVGVHRINAGWIASSLPEDDRVVREIAHLGLNAKVEAEAAVSKSHIDSALKADVSNVVMESILTDVSIKSSHLSRNEVMDRSIEITTYAKEHGLQVTFGLVDAPRADQEFLSRFVRSLEREAKADIVCISDSWGVTSPQGFAHLIRMVRGFTRLPIAVHCHNDLGLATANALAGLLAGAAIVTATVNGIGERCGLASLEEVAVALRILYNTDVGIKYDRLCELSRLVEDATGRMISKMKPVVGERAFAWEADQFVQNIRSLGAIGDVKSGLPYQPDFVGADFRCYPAKRIGRAGIQWEAQRFGMKLTDEKAEELAARIRELSKRKHQPSYQEFLMMISMMSKS